MIKLSWQLLNSQKKWFYLLVFLCGMTILTLALFQIIATTTEKYTLQEAQKKYGDFTGFIVDVEENRHELEKSEVEIGEYGVEDSIKVEETAIQLGFFDEKAFQMANFQLLEGSLPKKRTEAIIEEAYLEKLKGNEWHLGEIKKIGNQQLKLVGIIKNYSANWAINTDVTSTYYGFPNIIHLKTQQKTGGKHSFLIKEKNILENDNSEFAIKYGANYMVNDQFYYKGLQKYKVLSVVKYFFLTTILIISSISIYQIIMVYYKKQDILYTLLKVEGATKEQIQLIKVLQILLVLSIASILTLPIVYLFFQIVVQYLVEYNVIIPWKDLLVGGLLLGIILIALVVWRIYFPPPKLKYLKKIPIIYSFNLLVLTATLILLFTSIFIYKEEIVSMQNTNTIDISANRMTQTTEVDGYDVALPPRKYISINAVQNIRMYEGIEAVRLSALTDDLKIYQIPATAHNLESAVVLEEVGLVPVLVENELVHTLQIEKQLVKNEAVLIVPSKKDFQRNQLKIGEKLMIIRSDLQGDLKSWTYKIADVKVLESSNPNMKIAVNAQKAIETKLFPGFNDVEVILKPSISKETYTILLNKMTTLSALYNDGIVAEDDNPLAKLFKSYFVITFIVSILFSCMTIYFMLDRKLEELGHVWGIYLSQGMTKYKVWILLVSSIPLLWVQSVFISGFILLVLYINEDFVSYPIIIYIKYFITMIGLILVLFLIVTLLFYKRINKLSISQLLKRGVFHK